MAGHPKVFCSHRSVDKPRVKDIAAKLRAAGIDAWVDQWEIRPGDDIVAKINDGLASYDVGLLFLSKTSLESSWVTAEASTLIYQMIEDGKRVIPVMIDADAPVPPLLRPRARLGLERIEELIAAIQGNTDKPALAPPRSRTRERTFRIILRSAASGMILTASGLLKKTVYLDPDEWDELRRKSYEESQPISEIIRELIRAGLGLDDAEPRNHGWCNLGTVSQSRPLVEPTQAVG